MAKYDIVNPMQCNRVVHDVNLKQVMIPSGKRVAGVDMNEVEAKRLIDLAEKLGDGKEIILTKSADQSGAANQIKSNSK